MSMLFVCSNYSIWRELYDPVGST